MATILTRLRCVHHLPQSSMTSAIAKQLPICSSHVLNSTPVAAVPSSDPWAASHDKQEGGIIARLCHNLANNDHDKEIYSGILSTQIKLVKTFSLTTSCIGMACQPLLYTYSSQGNLAVMLASGAFLSFFTFVTPVLIHSVSKKYVTKLYYNQVEDKYTAVVYNIFIRPKKIEFKVSDVKVPDIPGMFTTFKAKNHALFVDLDQFRDPTHFGKIMGHETDVFQFENQDFSQKSKQ